MAIVGRILAGVVGFFCALMGACIAVKFLFESGLLLAGAAGFVGAMFLTIAFDRKVKL